MKFLQPRALLRSALICCAAACCTVHAQPKSIFGTWIERQNVCNRNSVPYVQNGETHWKEVTRCAPHDNVLRVLRSKGSREMVGVQLALEFNNGYGCSFEGEGQWLSAENQILARNIESECEVAVRYDGGRLHTVVRTAKQCEAHCGSFVTMDDAVFSRRRPRRK